jgi:hypothetical protein
MRRPLRCRPVLESLESMTLLSSLPGLSPEHAVSALRLSGGQMVTVYGEFTAHFTRQQVVDGPLTYEVFELSDGRGRLVGLGDVDVGVGALTFTNNAGVNPSQLPSQEIKLAERDNHLRGTSVAAEFTGEFRSQVGWIYNYSLGGGEGKWANLRAQGELTFKILDIDKIKIEFLKPSRLERLK